MTVRLRLVGSCLRDYRESTGFTQTDELRDLLTAYRAEAVAVGALVALARGSGAGERRTMTAAGRRRARR